VRQVAAHAGLGQATGWLYGINSLGAAVGCYLVGFHLLPEMGSFWTNITAATANLIVGAVAICVASRLPPVADLATGAGADDVATSVDQKVPSQAGSLGSGYLAAGLTGCGALMLQTVWNRQLGLVLGSSTYAFTAVLFVVMGAIGLGSLLFRAVFLRRAHDVAAASLVLTVLVLSTITGVLLLPLDSQCVGLTMLIRGNFVLNALVCIA